uniref:Carrier domain-containing protein n=1 Tax=viral metagenome TaxID=1070528 RepID=A0A6M3JPQ0_9ZZZZ
MSREEILKKLEKIINTQLCHGPVTIAEKTTADDLGADSLDFIEFIMAVEEAFDVEISDDLADEWHTMGDVVEYLEGCSS